MCTKINNFKIECPYEKSPIEINGLMAEIIVDNDTKEILNSLKKNDLVAIKCKPIKYLENWFKCTVEYQPGNLQEVCIFSFLFQFNMERQAIKKMLINAGGFITQEGQIPEIISFIGHRGIDVYFALGESDLRIDAQYLPLEKTFYNANIPSLSFLKKIIRTTELDYLLQDHYSKFRFNDK